MSLGINDHVLSFFGLLLPAVVIIENNSMLILVVKWSYIFTILLYFSFSPLCYKSIKKMKESRGVSFEYVQLNHFRYD